MYKYQNISLFNELIFIIDSFKKILNKREKKKSRLDKFFRIKNYLKVRKK